MQRQHNAWSYCRLLQDTQVHASHCTTLKINSSHCSRHQKWKHKMLLPCSTILADDCWLQESGPNSQQGCRDMLPCIAANDAAMVQQGYSHHELYTKLKPCPLVDADTCNKSALMFSTWTQILPLSLSCMDACPSSYIALHQHPQLDPVAFICL